MKKIRSLILLSVLAFVWICNLQLANSQSNLEIVAASVSPPNPDTLQPANLFVEVWNPDTVGHNYKLKVYFSQYEQSQNGYINAGRYDVAFFSFLAAGYGNYTIQVNLWQDNYDGGSGIQEKTLNVTVGKHSPWSATTTSVDSLNAKVQSLEGEISGLHDITNALTAGIILLLIVTIVVAVAVRRTAKRSIENAMQSKDK